VEIVERNVDECILCDMCVAVSPPGAVAVHRLYDAGEVLSA
jgi:Fe-S-cluster-containing hydrogenase component 2